MQPGPDHYYRCPECGNVLRNKSIINGSTAGATFFSDGSRNAPMMPEIPMLTKCPNCNTILWLNDLKRLGESWTYGTCEPDDPEWQNADHVDFLELNDLQRALDTLSNFQNQSERKHREIFIRQRIWWKYNSKKFESTDEIESWRTNCLDILAILNFADKNQVCMAAELYRNLCNFSKCLELVNTLPEKYNDFKERMIEECENGNSQTVNISQKKKLIETENHYDILQNDHSYNNELLINISEYTAEPDSPELYYNGGKRALLYRSPTHIIILENIYKEIQEQLNGIETVLVTEISEDKMIAREYPAKINSVAQLPEERGLQPLPPEDDVKDSISARLAEKISQDEFIAKNAFEFYKTMAGNGNCNIEAQYLLGLLYLDERFNDSNEATRWLEYAAFQGHKAAVAKLGNLKKL